MWERPKPLPLWAAPAPSRRPPGEARRESRPSVPPGRSPRPDLARCRVLGVVCPWIPASLRALLRSGDTGLHRAGTHRPPEAGCGSSASVRAVSVQSGRERKNRKAGVCAPCEGDLRVPPAPPRTKAPLLEEGMLATRFTLGRTGTFTSAGGDTKSLDLGIPA